MTLVGGFNLPLVGNIPGYYMVIIWLMIVNDG